MVVAKVSTVLDKCKTCRGTIGGTEFDRPESLDMEVDRRLLLAGRLRKENQG
jgi:hypothetical protein